MNITTLNKTYVTFANVIELQSILSVFNKYWFDYKNGSYEDAIHKAEVTVVDKIVCHDEFVLTSKEKVTTISYKVFMKLSKGLTSNETLISTNENKAMNNNGSAKSIINEIRANKFFKDEAYLEKVVAKADTVEALVDNFVASLEKAEDKANKVSELLSAYGDAVANRDVAEIERLWALIDGAVVYITKTNKILAGLASTWEAIIKAEKKDIVSAAEFIGE